MDKYFDIHIQDDEINENLFFIDKYWKNKQFSQ